jgi:hypothetical protein
MLVHTASLSFKVRNQNAVITLVLSASPSFESRQKHCPLCIPIVTIGDQFTMSLREDEQRSVDVERRDPEEPRRFDVGPLSTFLSPIDWLELINAAICRISLLMATMTPTSIPQRPYS